MRSMQFILVLLWVCSYSNTKQYILPEPKNNVILAANRLMSELRYTIKHSANDTIWVENNKLGGYLVISESGKENTLFASGLQFPGYNKKLYQEFVHGCLMQEMSENTDPDYKHKRKEFASFLLRNTISPIWGTHYLFDDNPFTPGKVKDVFYFTTATIDLVSIGMISYGLSTDSKSVLNNGVILFALIRGLNGANFNLVKTYNEHIHLKYDFNKINISF